MQGAIAPWSLNTDWIDPNGNNAVPGIGDSLVFNSGQAVMGVQGTNNPSLDDMAGLQLTAVYISGYGGTITLGQNLTTAQLKLGSGATIATAANISLIIDRASQPTPGDSNFLGGSLTGAGTVEIKQDPLPPPPGQPAAPQVYIDSSLAINQTVFLIDQGAKVTWRDGDIQSVGARIAIAGTLDMHGDYKILDQHGAADPVGFVRISGSGTLVKTLTDDNSQTKDSRIEIPLTITNSVGNTNSLDIQKGWIKLTGGGTIAGKVAIATGSSFYLDTNGNSVDYTLNNGANLTGVGTTYLRTSASLNVPADNNASVDRLELDGGTVKGGGNLTINKQLDWIAGTMSGLGGANPGMTTLAVNAVATIGSATLVPGTLKLDARAYVNNGTTTLTGGNSGPLVLQANNGAIINNTNLFRINDDSSIMQQEGMAQSKITNTGTLQKSGGTETSELGLAYEESGTGSLKRLSGKFKISGPHVSMSGACSMRAAALSW